MTAEGRSGDSWGGETGAEPWMAPTLMTPGFQTSVSLRESLSVASNHPVCGCLS